MIPATYNDKIDGTGTNHRISFGTRKRFRVLVDWIHYRYDSKDPDHHNPFSWTTDQWDRFCLDNRDEYPFDERHRAESFCYQD